MKKTQLLIFFTALHFLNGLTAFSQNKSNKNPHEGFALLELFTSEGCSSCPPADELMGKLQKEYHKENVYILAYHVDYWDNLGWKDIFSQAEFTKRQYQYAKFLGKEPIYTPQVIINGKKDLIGSQETNLRKAIKSALLKTEFTNLNLEINQTGNTLSVKYAVEGTAKNSNLLLALVQKEAKSNVKRGENANRILSHCQIVDQLVSVNLNKALQGKVTIGLPKNFEKQNFEIIGFVQDRNSGTILGVKRGEFN